MALSGEGAGVESCAKAEDVSVAAAHAARRNVLNLKTDGMPQNPRNYRSNATPAH
jgi:hypothetical protein